MQVVDSIKNRITRGDLKIDDKLGSHQMLAREFNVSKITIKKACEILINQGYLYTRTGIGTFIAERQSILSDLAKHKTVGLVLRDLQHPYFSMIVKSVEERAYEMGFSVLLSDSSGDIEKEENQIKHFISLGVHGFIIASLSLEYRATRYIQKLHESNFPYVMVSYIHDPDYWYIGSDHEYGGFIATEHLIHLGYQSIGYVHAEKGNLLSEVRKNGYYRALLENDIPYNPDFIFYSAADSNKPGMDRFELGFQFGHKFIEMDQQPESLVFYNDMVALGFIKAVREADIRVPEDVAVVGYDDALISGYASVPLTTVHQPADQIGRTAVEVIQKRIDQVAIGNRTIFKPSLVIRESCGARKKNMIDSPVPTIFR